MQLKTAENIAMIMMGICLIILFDVAYDALQECKKIMLTAKEKKKQLENIASNEFRIEETRISQLIDKAERFPIVIPGHISEAMITHLIHDGWEITDSGQCQENTSIQPKE